MSDKVFNEIDWNGDGRLSMKELLRASHGGVADSEVAKPRRKPRFKYPHVGSKAFPLGIPRVVWQELSKLDSDRDGIISPAEFAKLKGLPESSEGRSADFAETKRNIGTLTRGKKSKLKKLFDGADEDLDGQISRREFSKFHKHVKTRAKRIRRRHEDKWRAVGAGSTLARLDTNHDGVISKHEFLRAKLRQLGPWTTRCNYWLMWRFYSRKYDLMDRNGDGVLTIDDWLVPADKPKLSGLERKFKKVFSAFKRVTGEE